MDVTLKVVEVKEISISPQDMKGEWIKIEE